MNARNIALSDQHNPGQDIVATCAACWLGAKESQERIAHSGELLADIKNILSEAGLNYEGEQPIRHMVEVLIEDLGYDHGAEMIVTPCPVCQMNVEAYQDQTNKKYGTKFKMPVVYYSQLMTVAYGGSAREAGLDGNIIRATRLEEIASK